MNLASRYISIIALIVSIGLCHASALSSHAVSASKGLRISSDENTLIELTNAERTKRGLPLLNVNSKLMTAARGHSSAMARSNELTHTLNGKGPADRVLAVGYRYSIVAENIAYNQRTPKAAVKSWMGSEGHRANILNPKFREIGVGIAYSTKGEPYYTEVFGTRR